MKNLCFLLMIIITLFPIFSSPVNEKTVNTNGTKIFTDSLKREVEVKDDIKRIVPSGNVAELVLFSLTPEHLVGWGSNLSKAETNVLPKSIAELPSFGAFYGKKANFNKETLLSVFPDVIIDIGEIKGGENSMKKELDDLSNALNLPVVFISGTLETYPDTFIALSDLLSKKEEGEKLSSWAKDALEQAKNTREYALKSPITFYYSSSSNALETIGEGNFHGELLELLGLKNVIPSTFSSKNIMNLEELYNRNPDVIILTNKEAYSAILKDENWKHLDAVKNNKVYLDPGFPYPFLDNPPSLQRLLGIYYYTSLFFKEITDFDFNEKAKEFYSLYFHYVLSEEDLRVLNTFLKE